MTQSLEDFKQRYGHILDMFRAQNPVLQAQIRYAQRCEKLVSEIAFLTPNTLNFQQFFEICMELCTHYPESCLDTLIVLQLDLLQHLDTPYVRYLLQNVQRAEEAM